MLQSINLYQAFFESEMGLCGKQDKAALLRKIESQETRLHLIMLGCVLDSLPNQERWEELTALEGHFLADSSQVAYLKSQEVEQALRQARIHSPKHTARVWWQICRGVQGRFKGSIRALLQENDDNVLKIQAYLKESSTTFPVLSATFTSARWLDLVHRVGGVELEGWESLHVKLPDTLKESANLFGIDVDCIHVALYVALQAWRGSCEERNADGCGLEKCPRVKIN